MSEYHNQQAMDKRLDERRANPQRPVPMKVFYHISCMNAWQDIVTEQLRLLAHVKLKKATSCVIGSEADAAWCRSRANELGIALETPQIVQDLGLYEGPTLELLHQWACDNLGGSVLYLHTKGVSDPGHAHKKRWRRLMSRHVVADWKANLNRLAVADMVGVSWQELPDFPHFCGNFWMARCDWIAHLQAPSVYRRRFPHLQWAGQSWANRMYVETWIGSEGFHHIESFVCRNGYLWEGPQIFGFDIDIPGFSYEDGLNVELGGGQKPRGSGFLNVDKNPGPGVDHVCNFEELHPAGTTRLPFDDNSVGAVYSSHCFEHVRNLIGLLREVARICKVGARVEIVVPHWLHPMAMCHDHKQVIPPEQVRHWTEAALDYWWADSPKRLYHVTTEQLASERLAEIRSWFPHLNDGQIMSTFPGAANEMRYIMEVGPR